MQELTSAMAKGTNGTSRTTVSDTQPELHAAAVKWAEWALKNHTGEKLERALSISTAIVEFIAESEREDD